MQVSAQVHHPPDTDTDDHEPLTDDATSYVNNVGSVGSLSSQNSAAQPDTASHNGDGNLDLDEVNNTGYQTIGSVSYEGKELQAMAQVQHPQPKQMMIQWVMLVSRFLRGTWVEILVQHTAQSTPILSPWKIICQIIR